VYGVSDNWLITVVGIWKFLNTRYEPYNMEQLICPLLVIRVLTSSLHSYGLPVFNLQRRDGKPLAQVPIVAPTEILVGVGNYRFRLY
jgi:hypothetical protein